MNDPGLNLFASMLIAKQCDDAPYTCFISLSVYESKMAA